MEEPKDYKGIKGLYKILKKFDEKRSNYITQGLKLDADTIGDIFYDECAKQLLCEGYFLIVNESDVKDEVRLYLTDIELYYHEEKEGGIKDYVMYHIPERYKENCNIIKRKKSLPFFKLGTLNLHPSGVDITFEKCDEEKDKDRYRASFLIRGYEIKVFHKDGGIDTFLETKHPTHIYDDVFPSGFPVCKALKISWEPDNRFARSNIKREPRYHVGTEYNDDLTKKVAENLNKGDKTFTSGGKIYRQCQREWRFRIEPLPEPKDTIKQN